MTVLPLKAGHPAGIFPRQRSDHQPAISSPLGEDAFGMTVLIRMDATKSIFSGYSMIHLKKIVGAKRGAAKSALEECLRHNHNRSPLSPRQFFLLSLHVFK